MIYFNSITRTKCSFSQKIGTVLSFLVILLSACSNNVDPQLLSVLENDLVKFKEDHQRSQREGTILKDSVLAIFPGIEGFADKNSELSKTQPDLPGTRVAIAVLSKLDHYDRQYEEQIDRLQALIRRYQADSISTEEVRSVHAALARDVAGIADAYRQFPEYLGQIKAEVQAADTAR